MTFVGPWTGTVQQESVKPPTPLSLAGSSSGAPALTSPSILGGYAADIDAGFLRNGHQHFCAWGRRKCSPGFTGALETYSTCADRNLLTRVIGVAQDKTLIRDVVAEHQPDYVLVELGFNDVGWFVSDA